MWLRLQSGVFGVLRPMLVGRCVLRGEDVVVERELLVWLNLVRIVDGVMWKLLLMLRLVALFGCGRVLVPVVLVEKCDRARAVAAPLGMCVVEAGGK
jgi:hypothetical protein